MKEDMVPLKYTGLSDARVITEDSGVSKIYIWRGSGSIVDVVERDAKIIMEKTNDFERVKMPKQSPMGKDNARRAAGD